MAIDPTIQLAQADPSAKDSTTFVNVKNLGDQPAFYVGLAMRGAVEAANAFSQSLVAIGAKSAKFLLEEDPNEALSVQKLFADGVASQLQSLGGAVAGLQEMLKGAQTTPPVSSPGPVTKTA